MPWQKLTLRLEQAAVPKAEALLELAGAQAISVMDDGGRQPVLEPAPGTTPLWPTVAVRALFPSDRDLGALAAFLEDSLTLTRSPDIERLEDEQWIRAGRSRPQARRIRRRLLLTGAAGTRSGPDDKIVKLNFGLAFGTGEHPTTALCLEWLESEVEAGVEILDYGCGSGVLALAGLALGARRAWATDIEPLALQATAANASLNDFSEALWIGTPEELPAAEVDIVVANILAGPLIRLAAPLSRYLRPHGRVVLSGVLEEQCAEVEAAFGPYCSGFDRAFREGWARLVASRATSPERVIQ